MDKKESASIRKQMARRITAKFEPQTVGCPSDGYGPTLKQLDVITNNSNNKFAVYALNYPSVEGILKSYIDTHSLCSNSANALALGGWSDHKYKNGQIVGHHM